MDNKTLVLDTAAALFESFDADAAAELLTEDYIQHNPGVPTGAAPVIGMLGALKESGITTTIHRVIAEGDLVVMHVTYENASLFGADTLVAFDVFRVEDGKVAEHWDNLQAPTGPNPSGRTMTDGPTAITDLEKTAANKAVVEGFIRDVLHGEDPSKMTDYVSTETYLQHNASIGDGLGALGEAMAQMAEAGQSMAYTNTPIIVAEGNFVFSASEGTVGDTPTGFSDLFRLEDGKIVEHWDTMAPIPPAADWAHDNGKF